MTIQFISGPIVIHSNRIGVRYARLKIGLQVKFSGAGDMGFVETFVADARKI
jgi:hypothetical protein